VVDATDAVRSASVAAGPSGIAEQAVRERLWS
jgi:hypothetical protein